MAGDYPEMDPAMRALLEGKKPEGVPRTLSGVPIGVSQEMKPATDFKPLCVALECAQFLGKLRAAAQQRAARKAEHRARLGTLQVFHHHIDCERTKLGWVCDRTCELRVHV